MWGGGYGIMLPGFGGGGFKGGGKGKGKNFNKGAGGGGNWGGGGAGGIPDLNASLSTALTAAAGGDPIDDILRRSVQKITKLSEKYKKDDEKRLTTKGSTSQARVIVEEFVGHLMGSIAGICWEKPWFAAVDWGTALLSTVLYTFEHAKIFARTLKPVVFTYVKEGVAKYIEEERVQKAITDIVELSTIMESHRKKATQYLNKGYDDAHMRAPFGRHTNTQGKGDSITVLQDFVRGWMHEFVEKAVWDVLHDGLPDPSRESQISQITVLFQNLLDPSMNVIPTDIYQEIVNESKEVPPSPWHWIEETAQSIFLEVEASNQPSAKKQAKLMGKQ